MRSRNTSKACAGFTLVELIVVLVILAILASTSVTFVVRVMDGYYTTQNRSALIDKARPALERMTRQLRGALPYSVRIVNDGNCVQFMPIAAGGNYLGQVPDQANGAPASANVSVSPHTIDFGSASFVSIGALSASELYGAAAASRTGYGAGSSSTQLQLSPAKQWARNSINQRFYLLANPQAFCVVGDELRVYENLNVNDATVDLSAGYALLAKSVSAVGTPFMLQMGSEHRNTKVTMALSFAQAGESLVFTQEAMIRNVP